MAWCTLVGVRIGLPPRRGFLSLPSNRRFQSLPTSRAYSNGDFSEGISLSYRHPSLHTTATSQNIRAPSRGVCCRAGKASRGSVEASAFAAGNEELSEEDEFQEVSLLDDTHSDGEHKYGSKLTSSVFFTVMGAFLFGYHSAVLNTPLAYIASDLGFGDDTVLKGLVVSIMIVGGAVGSLAIGSISDRYGRRYGLALSTLPMILGGVVCGTADGLSVMMLGRVLTGLGVGASSALVPLYLGEISPPKIRGKLNGVRRVAMMVGILMCLALPAGDEPGWWRWLFFGSAGFAGIQLVACMAGWIEESPVWLLAAGRYKESRRSLALLQNIRGKAAVQWQKDGWMASQASTSTSASTEQGKAVVAQRTFSPFVINRSRIAQHDYMNSGVSSSEEDQMSGWKRILELFEGVNRKPMIVGLGLCALQAFCGSNTVIYFASSVFSEVGISNTSVLALAVGLPNLAGAVAALYLTDRWGRRPLLLSSFGIMTVSLAVLACSASMSSAPGVATVVALTSIPIYVFAFSYGAGPIPWLLYSELFPTRIRARATALCTAGNFVSNIVVGATFLPEVEAIGLGPTYAIYAVVCGVGYVFCDRLVIETKGLSLQEVEILVAGQSDESLDDTTIIVSPVLSPIIVSPAGDTTITVVEVVPVWAPGGNQIVELTVQVGEVENCEIVKSKLL